MMNNLKFATILFLLYIFTLIGNVSAQTVTPEPSVAPTSTIVPTSAPTNPPLPTTVIPGIPQGLSATVINDDRIDITWNRSANATAYELFRNNEMVAVVSSLLYSDNGLEPETSYSYKVRAYDGSNYSGFSTTVSATTKSETDETPNPTIPEGPEIEEKTPSVVEKFGFVTVGTESYKYNEIPKFDAGVDFSINGQTESYADIEVIVKSDPKSYFAKADEDGFWLIKVDTRPLEPGMHNFMIKISADDFPEIYESDEYSFEVSEKPVEEIVAEDSSFSTKVRLIVLGLIVLIILIFVVGVILAKKKGLFKKLSGDSKKESEEGPETAPKATFSEDMIQIDENVTPKPEDTQSIETQEVPPITEPVEVENPTTPPVENLIAPTTTVTPEVIPQAEVTNIPEIEENTDNKLGSSILENEPSVENSENQLGPSDPSVAHSIEEIDTDGVAVEVEDLGVNPYADVVRKSYSQEMPDEENLPVLDLSTGETSTESSFPINETESTPNTTEQNIDPESTSRIEDYSSTTPALNQNRSVNDTMITGVSKIPTTSIENPIDAEQPEK
jgi:hypothetical protein